MTKKLIIIMANTDPRNSEELGAPLFQAMVAASMSYEVDVICTGTAAKLLRKGVAEQLVIKEGDIRTVYDLIKDARAAGVKFHCCSPGLDLFGMCVDDVIPECSGVVGAAHFIEQVMSGESKVLSY
ncbi:MAG: peroxiredoxin [Hyphomicrobium sp.]|jgi:predicted peroxiredoxin|nr:MAG: peroxiredoxin [Hyphomicrobium sp.]